MTIIIVGGGIAGLYCAYNLEKILDKKTEIIIFEKEQRIGGRLKMLSFDTLKVVCGAGIGRFRKDHLLKKLLVELGMNIQPRKTNIECYDIYTNTFYPQDISMIKSHLHHLKKNMYSERYHTNFSQYFKSQISLKKYKTFCNHVGYTDFEHADIVDTILHYGFDDTFNDNVVFPVDWDLLIEKLQTQLKWTRIISDTEIISIDHKRKNIITKKFENFHYDKIIIAGTKNTLNIWHDMSFQFFNTYSQQIGTQPFLRMYIKTDKRLPFHTVTYIDHPLQKIIPMKNNIYMISYSDNQNAKTSYQYKIKELEKILNCKILRYSSCFHEIGTHFYYPLLSCWENRDDVIKYIQNPVNDLFIIGEMISNDQGWTEGALSSVQNILSYFR